MDTLRYTKIEGDSAYHIFSKSIGSFRTLCSYRDSILRFMTFVGVAHPSAILMIKPSELEKHIIVFLTTLIDSDKSRSYVEINYSPIKLFLIMNDVVLNWHKIRRFFLSSLRVRDEKQDGARTSNDRAYKLEEISKLLQVLDIRGRAAVLLLLSSGVRIGALEELRIRHIHKFDKHDIFGILVYGGQSSFESALLPGTIPRDAYFTFATPQATSAIEIMLDVRRSHGEVITADSPLFRAEYDKRDKVASRNEVKIATAQSFRTSISRAAIEIGLRTPNAFANSYGRHDVMICHGFRKTFNTALHRALPDDPITKERLMGHKVGFERNYLRPPIEFLLTKHVKAIPFLTVT